MTSPTSPAAPSDTVRLRQKLAASLDEGVYVDVVESIPSTNTALKESADSSDQHVLLALEQTAGVGRRGGAWLSPPVGNLYLSYAFHSERPLSELTFLPMTIAVALADEFEALFGVDCKIKWPNDIYLGGKKCGGILIETVNVSADKLAVIIGLGLNVAQAPSSDVLQRPATSLNAELEHDVAFDEVAAVCAKTIIDICRLSHDSLKTLLRSSWPKRDLLFNKRISAPSLGAGSAIARGLSSDGGLQVEFAGAMTTLYAGEVSLGHVDTQ
ncbi:MAG: biotin--[acetyl-CoA-carboxylase] ligase [Alteromonadaceae bacterium TMED101]|nr:MAG: biotin--[acetyl-CoA-carboxylase] ligase [Alteromonadaceae bacterium TMED101]